MSRNQLKTVETFFQLVHLPSHTAAINAALRLGVIDVLSEGQQSAGQIAKRTKLNLRGVKALLDVLCEVEMVEQFDGDYALSQAARMIPKSVWGSLFQQWMQLENALQPQHASPDNGQLYKQYLNQIEWTCTPSALKVADALGIGSERTGMQVLDFGCGAAIYSMTIAHRDPQSHITLVDNIQGLARARGTVNNLELQDRVTELPLESFLPSEYADQFDLVLIADQLHLFTAEEGHKRLAAAAQLLRSGGEIAIIDAFAGQPRGRTAGSIQELLVMIASGKNITTLKELRHWLDEVGFQAIQYTDLPAPPFTRGLILGSKP